MSKLNKICQVVISSPVLHMNKLGIKRWNYLCQVTWKQVLETKSELRPDWMNGYALFSIPGYCR